MPELAPAHRLHCRSNLISCNLSLQPHRWNLRSWRPSAASRASGRRWIPLPPRPNAATAVTSRGRGRGSRPRGGSLGCRFPRRRTTRASRWARGISGPPRTAAFRRRRRCMTNSLVMLVKDHLGSAPGGPSSVELHSRPFPSVAYNYAPEEPPKTKRSHPPPPSCPSELAWRTDPLRNLNTLKLHWMRAL